MKELFAFVAKYSTGSIEGKKCILLIPIMRKKFA